MAIQTSLFESLKINKVTFENNSQMYTIYGNISEFGSDRPAEFFIHYSEFNSLLCQILKSEETDHLYDSIKCFDTPEGQFYEMEILNQLGYSLQIDMEYFQSLNKMKMCA